MTRFSGFKSQASRTDVSLFCSDSHFFSTVWIKICSFRLFQVSFIHCVSDTLVGDSLSAQLIYRGKVVLATHSTIFADTIQNYISPTCKPRKLKSAKNNLHVFRQKARNFGDAKISHYTVIRALNEGTGRRFRATIRHNHKSSDMQNKMKSNDQELIQSDPTSCPQN